MSRWTRAGDIDRGDEIGLTPAGVLYCARCGCLLMEGYQGTHVQSHDERADNNYSVKLDQDSE